MESGRRTLKRAAIFFLKGATGKLVGIAIFMALIYDPDSRVEVPIVTLLLRNDLFRKDHISFLANVSSGRVAEDHLPTVLPPG